MSGTDVVVVVLAVVVVVLALVIAALVRGREVRLREDERATRRYHAGPTSLRTAPEPRPSRPPRVNEYGELE
jgi:hypothetical protein